MGGMQSSPTESKLGIFSPSVFSSDPNGKLTGEPHLDKELHQSGLLKDETK